jgi:ribosome-associated toxin RatA of RatAB toxin-antitoxin module
MNRVEKSVLVPFSASRMWHLVQDVASYPQFLPWCAGADVLRTEGSETDARLHVNYHGLKQNFTTRNQGECPQGVTMSLLEGPFRHLEGQFSFKELSDSACKITFTLEWSFSNSLLEKMVGPVFRHIADTMVDAFVTRAETLAENSAP